MTTAKSTDKPTTTDPKNASEKQKTDEITRVGPQMEGATYNERNWIVEYDPTSRDMIPMSHFETRDSYAEYCAARMEVLQDGANRFAAHLLRQGYNVEQLDQIRQEETWSADDESDQSERRKRKRPRRSKSSETADYITPEASRSVSDRSSKGKPANRLAGFLLRCCFEM